MDANKILSTLKEDGSEAADRVLGRQFRKAATVPLEAAIAKALGVSVEKVHEFLSNNELGQAIVGGTLSLGMSAVPATVGGALTGRLSRELRIEAMAQAGDVVADIVMTPLRQIATEFATANQKALEHVTQTVTKVEIEANVNAEVTR